MAWLERRGNTYHILFRFGGRRFKKSLQTARRNEAQQLLERIERRLTLIERGDIDLPEDGDLVPYLLSDGKRSRLIAVSSALTLANLFDRYRDQIPDQSLEASSLYTLNIHMRHLLRILGHRFDVKTLTLEQLQSYVNQRSREAGRRGNRVSPTTIRKELASFGGVWSWALLNALVIVPYPGKGLRFPKVNEKPPFQTRSEIERVIADGNLTPLEIDELWDGLYLTRSDIDDVLATVRRQARHPFLYPMVLMAAHTGARRSEIARSQPQDFHLAVGTVVIRERKRSKTRRTTRSVPLSAELKDVMADWLDSQAGATTFARNGLSVTATKASDHLKRTLAGTAWEQIRGWHVFRHSFISNCAASGIDQRMIDAWSGHQTEEMRRRYTHLFPDSQRSAMDAVFG